MANIFLILPLSPHVSKDMGLIYFSFRKSPKNIYLVMHNTGNGAEYEMECFYTAFTPSLVWSAFDAPIHNVELI